MKTKNPVTVVRRNVLLTLLVFGLLGLAIGCGGSSGEIPEEDPTARVIYLNEIQALPSLEVYANGAGPTPVELGVLTEPIELSTGPTRFALTAPGSTEAIVDSSLDLKDQLYLIAFTGNVADGNLALWAVDQAAPEIDSSQTAAEVVNLYDGDLTFDVYFGDEPLAMGIATRDVSAFTVTTPASGTLQVFNAGDDPSAALPVATLETSLEAGRATMVLMKNASSGNGIVLDTIVIR